MDSFRKRHKAKVRSNRTFMELKYEKRHLWHQWIIGSNRTFMELKWLSPVVIMSKTSF